jgi:hypothetical protein
MARKKNKQKPAAGNFESSSFPTYEASKTVDTNVPEEEVKVQEEESKVKSPASPIAESGVASPKQSREKRKGKTMQNTISNVH